MTKTEEALNKLVEMREDDIIAKTLLLCHSYAIREGSDYGVSIAEEAIIEYANTRTHECQEMFAVENKEQIIGAEAEPFRADMRADNMQSFNPEFGPYKVVSVIVTKKED